VKSRIPYCPPPVRVSRSFLLLILTLAWTAASVRPAASAASRPAASASVRPAASSSARPAASAPHAFPDPDIISPTRALTGRITGTVKDTGGSAIPGVNVILEGTSLGTATDVDGHFELTSIPNGEYVIRASAIGFRPVTRRLVIEDQSVVEVDLVMEEEVLESSEIVVTASRREQPLFSVPVSVAVLSAEDLAVRNITGLEDALRTMSGVQIQDNQVNIRGSSGFAYNTGSRVLLLLDGVPLLTPDTDGVPFDALPFAQIERVEVMKGPGSALYGSGAIGGVINVITRSFPEQPETLVRFFGGVHQPVRYQVWKDKFPGGDSYRTFGGVTVSHAVRTSEKFGYWVNLAFRKDQGYMNFNQTRVFHGYTKLGWTPDRRNRLDFLIGLMARKKDNFLFWNGARDALNPGSLDISDVSASPDPSKTPTGTSDNFNNQFSLLPSYTRILSRKWLYTAKGRLFAMVLRPIDNVTGKARSISVGTIGFRYGGEMQLDYSPSPDRHLTLGVSGDALGTKSDFFVTNSGDSFGSQPETAAYVHVEDALTDRLQLVAGLRLDSYRIDHTTTESKLSPKFSLAYRVSDVFSLRAAFGDGFRVPSFAERFTDNRQFFPIVRNLALRPERSRSVEFGLKTKSVVSGGGILRSDVSIFRNEYWNLIEPKLVSSLQAFQFINLTRARIQGGEATVEWVNPEKDLKFSLGYTYLNSDDLSENLPLSFRPTHLVVASADTRLWHSIHVGADFRFISEPERVDSDFALFVTDGDRLTDTRVLDLRTSYRSGSFRASLIVKNALEYYYLERPAMLGAPRQILIQLQHQF
jgi:outer membrane receptor for ferrienterochelin and colicins